jgi:hypothetical protein
MSIPQWSMLSNKRHGVYSGSGRGGRTSSSCVLKALYCSAPGVPVVGLLQARRERKRGFQVSSGVAEDIVGELENEYRVRCVLLCVSVRRRSSSRGWRVRSPFIDQGGGGLQCAPRYLATRGSATCYAVEWAAVRTILAAIWPSWPTLYPNSGGSRVEGRRMVAKSSDRLEGGADVGPYGVQE